MPPRPVAGEELARCGQITETVPEAIGRALVDLEPHTQTVSSHVLNRNTGELKI